MLETYQKIHPKPTTIAELKEALQMIWDSLPQRPINKVVKNLPKRMKVCVKAESGHFEHSQ